MDILSCIAECPDADATCPDVCYEKGSPGGQAELVELLKCMDANKCEDVACIEAQCATPLQTCLTSSTSGGGTPNSDGGVPPGSIPPELVGTWTQPGSTDWSGFTFSADGSATHSKYKETWIGTCSMSANTDWTNGSAVASGNVLTVTLGEGVTAVAFVGGCGTGYSKASPGKVMSLKYALDSSNGQPGIWLTDLACTGEYCENYYKKQ
jgi:hypothetical protein